MNIKDAANESGLPAKTLRYYEEIGLVVPARAENGYREYSAPDVHKLAFLARARGLGFSIEACRELLALWENQERASADVRSIAQTHLAEIEAKIAGLQDMRDTLSDLIHACNGDARPDCPILKQLEQG